MKRNAIIIIILSELIGFYFLQFIVWCEKFIFKNFSKLNGCLKEAENWFVQILMLSTDAAFPLDPLLPMHGEQFWIAAIRRDNFKIICMLSMLIQFHRFCSYLRQPNFIS